MREILSRGLKAAMDLMLPRKCLVCGRKLLSREEHLCLQCLADIPYTYFWEMSHNPMADKLNGLLQEEGADGLERYAYASALFFYHSEAQYRLIPYQIKYHGNIDAGRYFGKMLGRRLASSQIFADVDMVIPVPLHWTRKWKRGYNQAEVIAGGVADSLGCRSCFDIMKRIKRTETQTKVSIEEKDRNVSGAFAASNDIHVEGCRHILLIDDVFTTGSTLHACFVALRSVFPYPVRISVATLGFVGGA